MGIKVKRKTTIKQKVSYVLRQKQTRQHICHWPNCGRQVPPAFWGCREHWYMLPGELRLKIWRAYRPGQEKRMNPTKEYIKVAREVQKWIREYEASKAKDGV